MSVLANKIVYPFITVLRMLIIDILLNLSQDNSVTSVNEIVYRLLLSLGSHYSAILLREVITKIINKFRGNN